MNKKEHPPAWFSCLLCSAFLLGLVVFYGGWWVFASYCEASAYNRITGSNVSTWDAMFVELRVTK